MVSATPVVGARRGKNAASLRRERAHAAEAHHATLVRGVHFGLDPLPAGGARATSPVILQRTEQNFLPAVLDELAAFMTTGRTRLANSIARAYTPGHVLKLFQPVQRTFHVAMVELACDRAGAPRLDPARIESAGLVLRRVWRDHRGVSYPDVLEGWRQDSARIAGWIRFASQAEADMDPDPAMRRGATGNAFLDARLAVWANAISKYSEQASPMFAAPPATCKAAGRTVVYGVISTASTERAEAPLNATTARELFPVTELRTHISPLLRATTTSYGVPVAGHRVRVKSGSTTDLEAQDQRYATNAHDAWSRPWVGVNDKSSEFRTYTDMLRQLALEFDAWGESARSRALYSQLDRIKLPVRPAGRPSNATPDMRSAAELLRQQYEVLVRRERTPERRTGESWPEYPAVDMPESWPVVPSLVSTALVDAAKVVLDARLADMPQTAGRFDDLTAQYRIRVFVRVRGHGDCPSKIVWSDYSEPFIIAPWFDSSGAPPVPIPLPEVTPDFLKSIKPNVSFIVPGSLADFLNKNDPKNIMLGQGAAGFPGIKWICGFNIPIITICAFILLSIILSLLDIVFRWMAFVKICIPIPNIGVQQPTPPSGP